MGSEMCIRDSRSAFAADLQDGMAEAESLTGANNRMTVVIAVNYGGQWDIAHAARIMAEKVAAGEIQPEQISAESMAPHLSMADLPPPDLLIRTGGDQRISNFLLWQLAYAELYFTDVLWPDYTKNHLFEAILNYQNRERRFGKTSEQL